MSKYCAAVVHPDCENEPYCGAPMPCAKHAKREPVPLSDEEIAVQRRALADFDLGHFPVERRWLATYDHLTKQLAEAEQRLRDNVGPRSLARIADLERQLAAECIAKTVARRQLAERDQQLAESQREIARCVERREKAEALLNTPEIHDFAKAVVLEAAHQRERWGRDHDACKNDADWFWLIGHLAGKAFHKDDDGIEKRLHRIITVAAAACNWHAATSSALAERTKG